MKCCSPAEPPNYLYIKHWQPMGMEEKTATLTALFPPNQSMPHFSPSTHRSRLNQRHKLTVRKPQPGLTPALWLMTPVVIWRRSFCGGPSSRSPLRSKVNYAVWIHQIRGPADGSDIINNRQASGWGLHCFYHSCIPYTHNQVLYIPLSKCGSDERGQVLPFKQ